MKMCSVVGTRPQLVKYSAMEKALQNHTTYLIHTGQHYDIDMDEVFFNDLLITNPDINLGIGSGSHAYQTGKVLIQIEKQLKKVKPDVVLVYGDCNSTLSGALASAKLGIPVGHVQAGLRCHDWTRSGEINRRLTDHCCNYLFAPTETAQDNLKREGLGDRTYFTGDLEYEAFLQNYEYAKKSKILNQLKLTKGEYHLATVHRAVNTDNKIHLSSIIKAFNDSKKQIVFAVHPRTKKQMDRWNIKANGNVKLISPIGYLDMIRLEKNADKIITDSGGVTCEAFFMLKPCISLMNSNEYPELFHMGWTIFVGNDYDRITVAIERFKRPTDVKQIFGAGATAERIVSILEDELG